MKILMCSVPDGSLSNTLQTLFTRGKLRTLPAKPIAPFGILRILHWMEKKGYSAEIYDISNIIGATSIRHLEENINSIDITLTEGMLKEIEDIHLSDPNPCV